MITLRRTSRISPPHLIIQSDGNRAAITLFVPLFVGWLLTALVLATVQTWQDARRVVRWQAKCFGAGLYQVTAWIYAPVFRMVGL